jgi:hypothetical protein
MHQVITDIMVLFFYIHSKVSFATDIIVLFLYQSKVYFVTDVFLLFLFEVFYHLYQFCLNLWIAPLLKKNLIWLDNLSTLNVPDEGYSRNVLFPLN